MILRDWRSADAASIRAAYERERPYWDALGWDTAWTWAQVEQARALQRLPGFLASDGSGRLHGWTFFLSDSGTIHIGGLVADSLDATDALLDAVLQAADAEGSAVACFILDRAAGLRPALEGRGFDVEPFLYLQRPLDDRHDEHRSSRAVAVALAEPWRDGDEGVLADLLRTAYTPDAGRHFAADGNWNKYVAGLVQHAGCGVFDAPLTRLVRRGPVLEAAAVVTSLSPATAHLAQVAVHPDLRRRGLGAALVQQTMDAARRVGKRELTLLVGERNLPARRVYESLGFSQRATFLAMRAGRSAPGRDLAAAV